jgi:phosphohistidine phosphatase SixA
VTPASHIPPPTQACNRLLQNNSIIRNRFQAYEILSTNLETPVGRHIFKSIFARVSFMLKQLFLMHPIQDHSETLIEQGIRQAKLLDDKFVADETFPHVILCSSSPQAQKMAEVIATKFSLPRWAIPVETIGSLDDYDDGSSREEDLRALQDIEAAMQQHSVVLVVTSSLRVEGIARTLGQDVRLKKAECLVYERQQGLTEKGGSLTLAGRLMVNNPSPSVSVAPPKSAFPGRFFRFVLDHMTSRGLRIGALVSAAGLAGLGIIAEVDGRFGLSGVTEMKVLAGLEQPSVHIPLPWVPALYRPVKLAHQAGRENKKGSM